MKFGFEQKQLCENVVLYPSTMAKRWADLLKENLSCSKHNGSQQKSNCKFFIDKKANDFIVQLPLIPFISWLLSLAEDMLWRESVNSDVDNKSLFSSVWQYVFVLNPKLFLVCSSFHSPVLGITNQTCSTLSLWI